MSTQGTLQKEKSKTKENQPTSKFLRRKSFPLNPKNCPKVTNLRRSKFPLMRICFQVQRLAALKGVRRVLVHA